MVVAVHRKSPAGVADFESVGTLAYRAAGIAAAIGKVGTQTSSCAPAAAAEEEPPPNNWSIVPAPAAVVAAARTAGERREERRS